MVKNKERDRRMDSIRIDKENMKNYRPLFGRVVSDALGRLWFYDHRWMCIGNMASDLTEIEIVLQFKEEQIKQCGAAFDLIIKENILFIAFMKKTVLLTYNIVNHTYKLYKNNIEKSLMIQQYNSIFYKQSLIFIPMDISHPISILDLNNYQYMLHDREKYNGTIGNVYRFQNTQKLLMPVYNTNKVFVFEPETLNAWFMELNNDISVNFVYGTEEDLWICQNNKKVIINIKDGKTEYITIANDDIVQRDPFSGLIKYENKVIVLPRFDKSIYVIELETKVIKEIPISFNKEEFDKLGCSLIYGYHIYNSILYLFPWGLEGIIELRLTDYRMTKRDLQIKEKAYCEFIYQPPTREIEEDDLQNYIGWIVKH